MKLQSTLIRLQQHLAAENHSLCLIEDPVDLLYLTGVQLSAGALYVSQKDAYLFVDGRYVEIAKQKSVIPAFLHSEKALESFIDMVKATTLAFDSAKTSYDRYEALKNFAKKQTLTLVPCSNLLKSIRAIKNGEELEKMRQSAALLWRGFMHLQSYIRVGISERELALIFEFYCRKEGAEKLAFEPIIAFGVHSALPHHRAGEALLKPGEHVLVDIGVVLNHYHSDMTRVLFPPGVDSFFNDKYLLVQEAAHAALRLCKPGVAIKELDLAARAVFQRENMETYFIHSLGHGIGLETHEFPLIKHTGKDKDFCLKAGMVITIEPGLYFEGKGGLRYEDTIIITENGYDNLYPQ